MTLERIRCEQFQTTILEPGREMLLAGEQFQAYIRGAHVISRVEFGEPQSELLLRTPTNSSWLPENTWAGLSRSLMCRTARTRWTHVWLSHSSLHPYPAHTYVARVKLQALFFSPHFSRTPDAERNARRERAQRQILPILDTLSVATSAMNFWQTAGGARKFDNNFYQ